MIMDEEGQSLNLTEYTVQVTYMHKRRTRAYFFKIFYFFWSSNMNIRVLVS